VLFLKLNGFYYNVFLSVLFTLTDGCWFMYITFIHCQLGTGEVNYFYSCMNMYWHVTIM